MKLNVRFTFNRTPLKLMHRALEIGYKVIEEDRLSSLKLQIGTHLDPLLDKEAQDLRWEKSYQCRCGCQESFTIHFMLKCFPKEKLCLIKKTYES